MTPDTHKARVQAAIRATYPVIDGMEIEFVPADEDTDVDQVCVTRDPVPGGDFVPRQFIAFNGVVYTMRGEGIATYSMEG